MTRIDNFGVCPSCKQKICLCSYYSEDKIFDEQLSEELSDTNEVEELNDYLRITCDLLNMYIDKCKFYEANWTPKPNKCTCKNSQEVYYGVCVNCNKDKQGV